MTSKGYSSEPKGYRPLGSSAKKTVSPEKTGVVPIRHDFTVALRQVLPVLVVAFVVFCVLIPVSTAAVPETSIFNLDYTHDQLKFRFFAEELSLPIILAAAGLGVALGLRSFGFLLVKRETTAFFSLPLSRAALFTTRYAAGVAAVLVSLLVPLVISLTLNILAVGVWSGLFGQFAYVCCGLVLVALVSFSLTAFACALSGTKTEALMCACALICSVSAVAWGLNSLMDWLLVGNAFGESLRSSGVAVADSLLSVTSVVNPLLFFADSLAEHQIFIVQHPVYEPVAANWVLLACWLAVLVAFTALALLAVVRRRGEVAGMAGCYPAMTMVVGLVAGIAAFGATFKLLASVNIPAALVAAFAVFLLVSLTLLRGPLRGNVRHRRIAAILAAETVVLAVIVVVIVTGGLGYSSRVPDAADVTKVEVSYTGSPNYFSNTFDTATSGTGSYYYSAPYTLTDTDDIAAVVSVQAQLIGSGHAELATDRFDFSSTVVPYDVVIRYTMADGGEMVRYYDRATYGELLSLAEIDEAQTIKTCEAAVITGDTSDLTDDELASFTSSIAPQAYLAGSIYIADSYLASPVLVQCDAEARMELLAALAHDVTGQSVEDRYHPSDACVGTIMFTQSGEVDADSFAYALENTVIYLTPSFTETLAWLKANGLASYVSTPDTSIVESLSFQSFDPYTGINEVTIPQSAYFMAYRSDNADSFVIQRDFGTNLTISDAEKIAEVMPLVRNSYFMDGGGYLVAAKLAGIEKYTYFFLPADLAPEWLVRSAG